MESVPNEKNDDLAASSKMLEPEMDKSAPGTHGPKKPCGKKVAPKCKRGAAHDWGSIALTRRRWHLGRRWEDQQVTGTGRLRSSPARSVIHPPPHLLHAMPQTSLHTRPGTG